MTCVFSAKSEASSVLKRRRVRDHSVRTNVWLSTGKRGRR
jgi:hypothetical protein